MGVATGGYVQAPTRQMAGMITATQKAETSGFLGTIWGLAAVLLLELAAGFLLFLFLLFLPI